MEIRGTFAELIAHASELIEGADTEPLQIFVQDSAVITSDTLTIISNEVDAGEANCSNETRYRYVLMLRQAQDVLTHWRENNCMPPTLDQACQAIMFYSDHDQFQPASPLNADYRFLWPVTRRRGDL